MASAVSLVTEMKVVDIHTILKICTDSHLSISLFVWLSYHQDASPLNYAEIPFSIEEQGATSYQGYRSIKSLLIKRPLFNSLPYICNC